MATKLTAEEVLAQFQIEYPEAPVTPEALKRMRGTLLKRAERLRKKNAEGLTAATKVRPTLDEAPAAIEAIAACPVHSADEEMLPPAVQVLAVIVAPAPEPFVALGTCTGRAFVETPNIEEVDKQVEDAPAGYTVGDSETDFPGPEYTAEESDQDGMASMDTAEAMTEEEKQECRLDQQDDAAKDVEEIVPVKRRYIGIAVLSGGVPLPEVEVDAISEKEANKLVWAGLSEAQKDNCEYIDFVDIKPIPTVLVSPNLMVAAVNAAAEGTPTNLNEKVGVIYAGLDSAIKTDFTPGATTTLATPEDEMKKAKKGSSTKKAGKRVAREEIVKQVGFINLFEKARKAMRDPEKKTCKHGHKISAENAHVGDLKRTGRYTCNPCNDDAQARYNVGK